MARTNITDLPTSRAVYTPSAANTTQLYTAGNQ